jgi:hypothetical protein
MVAEGTSGSAYQGFTAAEYGLPGPYRLSQPVEVIMTDTVRVFRELPAYTLGPRSCTLQFEVR